MRINKYIAGAGVASRRKADELIASGQVKVNGAVLTKPGYDVLPGDLVEVRGRAIRPSGEKLYYAMNKPMGCVTTVKDDEGRTTVMDYIRDVDARLFPVGRLDYNTSGLLFLTNDGDFAYKLSHPKHRVDKKYLVRIAGNINKADLSRLRKGVVLDTGFRTSPAQVNIITWTRHSTILDITIHEGKKRQIRKMFEAVGHHVVQLERVSIGNIQLGHLKPGHYRKLNPSEVRYLMNL